MANKRTAAEKNAARLEMLGKRIREHGYETWLGEELIEAFGRARLGKRGTEDEHRFEVNWIINLGRLREAILRHKFVPGSSICFVIFDPMVREIFAAPFRDRVVHHFLYNMSADWWDRRFIYDSYSCRREKGVLFGVRRTQGNILKVSDGLRRDAYVMKFDLKGYFMSLPRERLVDRVVWGLNRQFGGSPENLAVVRKYPELGWLKRDLIFLWKQVLLDDPVPKARKRGAARNWDMVPQEKSLFCQPEGKGIVIGNLTSQLVSNIYLDGLDRFITGELGYKHYGRYVDDFYIMVEAKDLARLKRDVERIERFVAGMGLSLHAKKRYCQDVRKGVNYLGARIYPNCLLPSARLQSHFREAAVSMAEGRGRLESVVSYLGLLRHMDGQKITAGIFDQLGWDFRGY